MVALRESPAKLGFRAIAPISQVLGEPRFRWGELDGAWLYRVQIVDAGGVEVARGWSGMHELPLGWCRDNQGHVPRLEVGRTYRWRVYAYHGPPTDEPSASAPEATFLYLGP